MTKRKVLIVIHQLNIGGVQKSLIPLLDAVDYEKNEVTLYIRKDRTDLLPLVNKNVSRIIINKDRTRYYRKPYSVCLVLLIKLKEILKMNTDTLDKKLNNYVINSMMRYEKKNYFSEDIVYDVVVSCIQSYTAKFVRDNINANKKVMLYRTSTDGNHEMHMDIMKDFHSIYCVSNGAKDVLANLYPKYADKMGVIDTFVDFNEVLDNSGAYPVDKAELTIVSCGRIVSDKGFDMAVKAAKYIKDLGVKYKWYFVGDGRDSKEIMRLIDSYNLNDDVYITGYVENPYPYIKACDIYVQPSYEESFGRTIKEAMILQKPVVSTKTVGACEQITDKENGLITDISVDGLVEGIKTLLSNKDLYDNIVDNLKRVDYSKEFDNYRKKLEELLN